MNVQEVIDKLMKIEDKTMEVMLADWNEQYLWPAPLNSIEILDSYKKNNANHMFV
jgi:hypothetical protein